jgi:carbamoyltransferase
MSGAFLGPAFSNKDIENLIRKNDLRAQYYPDEELFAIVAKLLPEGRIIGWFQGRMEFVPRALGNRSIIADPQNTDMQKKLNMEIKFRESFRPFAPAVLEEDASEYFNMNAPSPYMLLTAPVTDKYRLSLPDDYEQLDYSRKLYTHRSRLQAITHVDFSARVQTVSTQTNPRFHALIKAFKSVTGCGLVVNTSFNVRNEPIVCSPDDAYRCFINTGMDYLVLENYVFAKNQ